MLNGTVPYSLPLAKTTDNCSASITGSTTLLVYTTPGSYVVTWTFTDAAGNTSLATQSLKLLSPPPTLLPVGVVSSTDFSPEVPILESLSSECFITVPIPIAEDEEDGLILGTTSDSLNYSIPGNYIVNWTFSDSKGNSITAVQTVTILEDSRPLAPSLMSLKASCNITVPLPVAIDDCDGEILGTTDDSLYYDSPGDYWVLWSFTDSRGNTTSATQNIIVEYLSEQIYTQTACVSFTWLDGVTYTENTNVTFETIDAEGCKTLHRLDLTIITIDSYVEKVGNTLTAFQGGAEYQWIDCNLGNTPVAGATQQSFTAATFGNFAVRVQLDNCEVISECFEVNIPRALPIVSEGISVNGDGINDVWMIQNIENFPKAAIHVYNRTGEEVFSVVGGYNNDWRGNFKGNEDKLPSGPYFYILDFENDGAIDQHGWLYIKN